MQTRPVLNPLSNTSQRWCLNCSSDSLKVFPNEGIFLIQFKTWNTVMLFLNYRNKYAHCENFFNDFGHYNKNSKIFIWKCLHLLQDVLVLKWTANSWLQMHFILFFSLCISCIENRQTSKEISCKETTWNMTSVKTWGKLMRTHD